MVNPEPPQKNQTKSIGKGMALIAWIIGMLMAIQFFGSWEEDQINPNRRPDSQIDSGGIVTVTLQRNRSGHYITSGQINGKPVTFLLDTGATDVVIPEALANRLGLPKIGRSQASTANGIVEVYGTIIESLRFGNIHLQGVRASINPGMTNFDEILLGMSALKYLDFKQQGDELIIHQYPQ